MAELLLCEGDIAEMIPARISNQLSRQLPGELRRLSDETNDFLLTRTMMELDVDTHWEKYVAVHRGRGYGVPLTGPLAYRVPCVRVMVCVW